MSFNNLEEKAQEAKTGKTAEERIDALLQAFELFCQETSKLEQAYKNLQEEFHSVNLTLDETNRELESKVSELNRLTTYLESILSHISQGLLFIQLNGTITTFNDAFEAMLSLKKEEVLNRKFEDVFKDTFFGFSMREALLKKQVPPFSRIRIGEENERFYEVECTFLPKTSKRVEGEGIIVLMRDVTRIKVLELIANRNDRMKELGEMAAQVAHEIRNPLGGIKGFASLLKRDLSDRPEQSKMAEYIIEGTDHLNRLVTQVLHYSRPITLNLQEIDVSELIQDVQKFIKLDSNIDPQPRLLINLPPNKLSIQADYSLLKGAILNLLINSCQAMPNGGTLTIHADKDSTKLKIQVSDTGIGIPKENMEKLFTPFFTTKANGNGFGLAEVNKTIQAHGGTVEVVSEVNKGTIFTITLPTQGL